jgi:uncharacterized membrane protein
MAQPDPEHPEHLREAGETINELRAQRLEELPKRERLTQDFVARIGRPRFVLAVAGFILAWVLANLLLRPSHHAFDTDTFAVLNLISQLFSLVIVLAILSGQQSMRTLEEERDRLTLQMSLIVDKKISEALRNMHVAEGGHELREPTDLHQAAEVLRKAEEQAGADE